MRLRFLYIIAGFLCTLGVQAQFSEEQQHFVDSLNQIISEKASDTAVAKAYVDLTEIYYLVNPDTIIPLCKQSLIVINNRYEFAGTEEKLTLLRIKASALNNMGWAYKSKGDYYKALAYYEESYDIEMGLNNKAGMAESLNNLGQVYRNQGDMIKAIENFSNSLSLREEINDKYGIANSLNNLALIYFNQGDQKQAIDFFTQSMQMHVKLNNKIGVAHALNNIGYVYFKQKSYQEAEKFYRQSLEILQELGDKNNIANTISNIGTLYQAQEKWKLALDQFKQSLEIYEHINSKKGICLSLNDMANVEYENDQLKASKEHAIQALEIAKEIGYAAGIRNAAETLSDIYYQEGNGMAAADHYKLFIQMRDSIRNMNTEKEALKQRMKYVHEKEQAVQEIEHNKQLEIAAEKEQKQKIISFAAIFGLLLVLAFAYFINQRLKITRLQKQVIEIQKTEIDQSIAYAKRIQEAILPGDEEIGAIFPHSFVLYKPKDVVSGDFYWMGESKGKTLIAAVDCTGHGVPGAFMSMLGYNILNQIVEVSYALSKPSYILEELHVRVQKNLRQKVTDSRDGMDMALLRYDKQNKRIDYAGANRPLYLLRDGKVEIFKADRHPIGGLSEEKVRVFNDHRIDLQEGDTLYIFSDGYADQFGGTNGKKFMNKRFRDLILNMQNKSMSEQKYLMNQEFIAWQGDLEQVDDVLVIGIRV